MSSVEKIPEVNLEVNEDGEPVVYKRRWLVMIALGVVNFSWCLSNYRHIALVPELALYYDTTNEFSLPPEYGIDFLSSATNGALVILYPLGAYLLAKYGLKMINVGAVLSAVTAWMWFFAGKNFGAVIGSKLISTFAGTLTILADIRLVNHWFPSAQRPVALALGNLFVYFGSGSALVYGTFFYTERTRYIELDLKSCALDDDYADNFTSMECTDDALANFCCTFPLNVSGLNLSLAIITTVSAVFSFLFIRDAPGTAPSGSGYVKVAPSNIWAALKILFSNRNFTWTTIAEFIYSGSGQVVFTAVARLFPLSVADYYQLGLGIGYVCLLPIMVLFSRQLGKSLKFYEYTVGVFATGAALWISATIAASFDSFAAAVLFLTFYVGVIMTSILGTVPSAELTLEYVYDTEYSMHEYLPAVRYVLGSASGFIFISAIPPERFTGYEMDAALITFLIGLAFVFVALVILVFLPDKRKYKRTKVDVDVLNNIKQGGEEPVPAESDDGEKKEVATKAL